MSRTTKDMPYKVKHKDEIEFYENLGDNLRSYYGGALCHCPMCGSNNANKYNRKLFLRNGFPPDTDYPSSDEKKQIRKRLRNKLKHQLRHIEDEY